MKPKYIFGLLALELFIIPSLFVWQINKIKKEEHKLIEECEPMLPEVDEVTVKKYAFPNIIEELNKIQIAEYACNEISDEELKNYSISELVKVTDAQLPQE